MILIADLGATNARFCITEDGNSYSNKVSYPINSFDGLEKLCNAYLASQDLVGIQKAVIGVAAPITGDIVNFINTNLEFSIQNLRNKLKQEIDGLKTKTGKVPGLAVVQVGNVAASSVYVKAKTKSAIEVGIEVIDHHLPEETNEAELLQLVDDLNKQNTYERIGLKAK